MRNKESLQAQKQYRDTIEEFVVKCSLSGRLKNKNLLSIINERVLSISKIMNKGSLLFNRILLHCLENNKELPVINQSFILKCFNIGVGRINKRDDTISTVWDMFDNYPQIIKYFGDAQLINYAARKYLVNFQNYLKFSFENKQKYHVYRWCKTNNIENKREVINSINNWSKERISNDFISEQREILGDGPINQSYIIKNQDRIIKYFYYILKRNKTEGGRLFHLAPICGIKRQFITIDTTGLYGIMKNKNIKSKTTFSSNKDKYWSNFINIKGLSRHVFSHVIDTDGVSLNVHFHRPKRVSHSTIKYDSEVIAIDPGRTNIIYGISDKGKRYRLTRGTYYNSSGMNKSKKKHKAWAKQIEKEENLFAEVSLKDGSWDKFLFNYYQVYNTLWKVKTQLKYAREKLRVYCLKNKTLDRFFNTMKEKGKKKPVIAFGAAKFNPNGKNELSAPTTSISRRCSKFYRIKMIDEFRTSKMCSYCGGELSVVCKRVDDKSQQVRGLRWCSTKCLRFVNRDLNAALNIMACYKNVERPNHLSRVLKLDSSTIRPFYLKDRRDKDS